MLLGTRATLILLNVVRRGWASVISSYNFSSVTPCSAQKKKEIVLDSDLGDLHVTES